MSTHLKLFGVVVVILLALDASWIGVIAAGFYHSQFGAFFSATPNLKAAALFYVLYAIALIYFVVLPALKVRSLTRAVLVGAALGFTAYMTYDLTNLATLAGWPAFGAAIDVAWGTLMAAVTCGVTYIVATNYLKL